MGMTSSPNVGGGTKSKVKILANIFISFIGAGVLGLPYAFKESGVLEGVLVMTFVAVVSVKAMLLVIDCKYEILNNEKPHLDRNHGVTESLVKHDIKLDVYDEKDDDDDDGDDDDDVIFHHSVNQLKHGQIHRELTYGDVGFKALGAVGRSLVDTSILISQVGFCCAYLIFITENLSTYVETLTKYHWLVIIIPPLFFLTLLKDLSSLAVSSLFAQISNLFAFLVVFWFDFEHAGNVRTHPKQMSIEGFPFFFAVAIYCYEGAGMILSLECSLHSSVRHKFKRYFILTISLVTCLYIVFGMCGYLSFGPETKEIITLNLPQSGLPIDFAMLVKLSLCLSLFFTYPVMMFPVSKLLDHWSNSENYKTYIIIRVLLVLSTAIVVLIIPNFAHLMALVGATCCTLLGFILPALFHILIGKLTLTEKCLDVFIISVGIIGAVIGSIDALKRLYEDEDLEINSLQQIISANTTSPNL